MLSEVLGDQRLRLAWDATSVPGNGRLELLEIVTCENLGEKIVRFNRCSGCCLYRRVTPANHYIRLFAICLGMVFVASRAEVSASVLSAAGDLAQTDATSEDLKRLRSKLQAALDTVVADDNLPGATLAISLPNGQQLSIASGFEDVEASTAMPVDGQMMVGSTGKTFVAAVALQLVTEGKIELTDLVSKYFSDSDKAWFSRIPNAETLTIRALMNHTSGLPRYVFAKEFLESVRDSPLQSRTPRECLSGILGTKPQHAVGEGWGYSDTNYLLLGLIIEKVTGHSFYDEAQRRLLGPLRLTKTIPTSQAKLPGLMQAYIGRSNPFGLPRKTVKDGSYAIDPSFEWCGGGYYSSVGDLANWMQALHGGKVLEEKVYLQMIAPVSFRTGKPAEQGYGLGAFVWQTEIGELVGHAGMMPGYLTQIEYSRKYGFSVAYQMNTDEGSSRKNHVHVVNFSRIVKEYLEEN